jgi:poly-beta-1,6-N-acetyl-D-glucosamine biosynthesis protein PgaD
MSPREPLPWPPLVGTKGLPRAVRVRDVVLTVVAWAALGWLLRDAMALAWDWLRAPMFTLTELAPPDWIALRDEIAPYMLFAAVLVAWLIFWAVVRHRRICALPPSPQPRGLDCAEEAAALALDPAQVAQWREWRTLVVDFDDAGRPVDARRGTI